MANWMDGNDVAMLVITEADYSNIYRQPAGTTNPRTEIIVRQVQEAPPSDWFGGDKEQELPNRSCLTDEPIGFSFRTGIGGGKHCRCVPKSHLNCDATL